MRVRIGKRRGQIGVVKSRSIRLGERKLRFSFYWESEGLFNLEHSMRDAT